jgi:hypothetical protein
MHEVLISILKLTILVEEILVGFVFVPGLFKCSESRLQLQFFVLLKYLVQNIIFHADSLDGHVDT